MDRSHYVRMYVGEGPILPAALPRHSSSTFIQSSEVLPKLKFQPSYIKVGSTDIFPHATAGFARPEHFKMPFETLVSADYDQLRTSASIQSQGDNKEFLLRSNVLYKDLQD